MTKDPFQEFWDSTSKDVQMMRYVEGWQAGIEAAARSVEELQGSFKVNARDGRIIDSALRTAAFGIRHEIKVVPPPLFPKREPK